ncbi:MAG TPA: sulfatase-like hydrolase/transferase [Anaeromyxobacteraceae bacterium]|nr:sulfatase-like hydrolase/transferase [Anaeromyxobacteraceae bacterium]
MSPAPLFTLSDGDEPSGEGYRFPALVWALLHAPLFLLLYSQPVSAAVRMTPASWRAALWPTFIPQAALLSAILFLVALPSSRWPRAYRFAAPAIAALGTFVLAIDSRVYAAVGFHLNGFFFRVLLQPTALQETGIPVSDVVKFVAAGAAFAAADVAAGAGFIRRFASPRRAWRAVAAILLLATGERVYGAMLTHFGGAAIFAASTVLPLQPPVRMEKVARTIFGGKAGDPFARAGSAAVRLPSGVDPATVKLTRPQDVVFVVAESMPSTHLDAETMPRLWKRAQSGTRFPRHYSGSSATNYTLFSLLYGLNAHQLEASVGAGLRPVLFPALRANGYQLRVLAASCVDWMGLKDTVFAGVGDDLETWCPKEAIDRDALMLASAEQWLARTDDRPAFIFLFFFGTHFNYFYPERSARFAPAWDGEGGGLKATTAPADQIERRARNAAYELDWKLDDFLERWEAKRGRKPIVVFTADHGEEFRQKGHIGHGSAVVDEQVHVPMVLLGDGVPAGVRDVPTGHVDVVPTLLSLLGDTHAPSLYADGRPMLDAPPDRFMLTTVGWEPHYAVIGKDLKVTMYAGLGDARITDPEDREIPDAQQRFAAEAGKILKALGR